MIEKNLISLIFVWLRVEKWRDEKKISLNKFTHILLLKNDAQLKQKNEEGKRKTQNK